MRQLNVLLADAYPVVRSGFKTAIQLMGSHYAIWEAAHGQEISNHLKTQKIDLIIVNVALPSVSAHTMIDNIIRDCSKVRTIVFATHEQNPFLNELSRLGVQGILSLHSSVEEIQGAVRTVMIGDRYQSQSISADDKQLIPFLDEKIRFSVQEKSIVSLLAQGKTRKEIAYSLAKTPKTIETYRCRLLKKTKTKNTTQLVHYFSTHKLILVNQYNLPIASPLQSTSYAA